jgi:hypothetical protein
MTNDSPFRAPGAPLVLEKNGVRLVSHGVNPTDL